MTRKSRKESQVQSREEDEMQDACRFEGDKPEGCEEKKDER